MTFLELLYRNFSTAVIVNFILASVFRLPSGVKKIFHPIICCTLSADLAAFAFGHVSRSGLDPVLGTLKCSSSLFNSPCFWMMKNLQDEDQYKYIIRKKKRKSMISVPVPIAALPSIFLDHFCCCIDIFYSFI